MTLEWTRDSHGDLDASFADGRARIEWLDQDKGHMNYEYRVEWNTGAQAWGQTLEEDDAKTWCERLIALSRSGTHRETLKWVENKYAFYHASCDGGHATYGWATSRDGRQVVNYSVYLKSGGSIVGEALDEEEARQMCERLVADAAR